MANDTVTLVIEGDDGTTDELTVSATVLDMLREGEESDPAIIGDIATFGIAQRIHSAVHHSQGEQDDAVVEAEETTMELFEDRFGATFGELTGHDH